MAEENQDDRPIGDRITQPGVINPTTGNAVAPSLEAIRLGLSAFGSRGPISPEAAKQLGEVQGFQQGVGTARDVLGAFQQGQAIRQNQINLETLGESNQARLEAQRIQNRQRSIQAEQQQIQLDIQRETQDAEVQKVRAQSAQAFYKASELKRNEESKNAFYSELNSGDPQRVFGAITNDRFTTVTLDRDVSPDVSLAIQRHGRAWTPEMKKMVEARFTRPYDLLRNESQRQNFDDKISTFATNPTFQSMMQITGKSALETFRELTFKDASKLSQLEQSRVGTNNGPVAVVKDDKGNEVGFVVGKDFNEEFREAKKAQSLVSRTFLNDKPVGFQGAPSGAGLGAVVGTQGARQRARTDRLPGAPAEVNNEERTAPGLREQNIGVARTVATTARQQATSNLGFRETQSRALSQDGSQNDPEPSPAPSPTPEPERQFSERDIEAEARRLLPEIRKKRPNTTIEQVKEVIRRRLQQGR